MRKKSLGSHVFRLTFSCFLLLAACVVGYAQEITVAGRVTDSKTKAGLPNVSVVAKNSQVGASTDANGDFTIKVASGTMLVITNVNYVSQEVTARAGQSLNIELVSETGSMEEVVVIGYGSRQKKDLTSAVSSINAAEIEKSTSMTPELALQGRVPGVFIESGGGNPNARPTIRIRGTNTFGYADPLYVVDGVPIYEGGAGVTSGAVGDIRGEVNIFSLINPADIESISVLKDASSAAIYGVRASNGVILITTKKGKSGRPRVDVTGSYGIQNIPKTINTLNTQQYMELLREAYNNFPDANSFEEKYGPRYDPNSPDYAGNNPTYDWQRELLNKNASLQDYNVRVSGGNDATTYFFSAGFARTESPLKGNNLERFSLATNIESKISKVITAGLNLRLVQSTALDNTSGSLGDMISTVPFQPFYDANDPTGFAATGTGTIIQNPDYDPTLLSPGAPYILAPGTSTQLWGSQTRYNIFARQALNYHGYDLQNFLGTAFIQIEPLPGLKLKGTIGGGRYLNYRTTFTNNEIWRFSQPIGAPFQPGQNEFAKGQLGERNTITGNLMKQLTLMYNKVIGDHSFDVVLDASEQFTRWEVSDLSGQVDYVDRHFWSIGNRPPNTQGFSNIMSDEGLIGYMGRLSYKFSDKYYLDVTVRRDGSSRLAPGKKWDNFPSFGAAWRISNEDFFPKNSFINDLKLRGGWGRLGNVQSAPAFAFLSSVSPTPDYAFGSGNGNGVGIVYLGSALPNFANQDLTWEKIREMGFGLDAMLFNNRLSFTAEYFDKTTFDVIQNVSLPPNTGIQVPATLNVGQVRNQGFEFSAGYNERFGELNFGVSANIQTTKNRVVRLNGGDPFGDQGARVEEGYPLFYLWGYKVGGVFQSQAEIDRWAQANTDGTIGTYPYQPGDMYFQDVYGNPKTQDERYSLTPDSIINDNDRTIIGKTIPGFNYGFSFNADWKGIDLSVFFQGVGDIQRYNGSRLEGMGGMANSWATVLNRWTPTNPSTTMPRAVNTDPARATRFSDRFVENASYLRLKNIQLGYTLPTRMISTMPFVRSIRMYVSGVNVLTFTNYTGLDPENDFLPPTRQFLVGINASF